MAIQSVGWLITAKHFSIIRSLVVIDMFSMSRRFVLRLNKCFLKCMIDVAIGEAVKRLNNSSAMDKQSSAIRELFIGRDVLVVLPTGSGKSLCYAALPKVFDIVKADTDSHPL